MPQKTWTTNHMKLIFFGRHVRLYKKARISFTIVYNAIQIVFFEHRKFFLFCLFLSFIQLTKLFFVSFMHKHFTLGFQLQEILSGTNVFELLWQHFSPFALSTFYMFVFSFFEYAALGLVGCVLIYCTYRRFLSYEQAHVKIPSPRFEPFIALLKNKAPLICLFAFLQTCICLVTALVGPAGNILLFVWELITVFCLQIITFENISMFDVLKKSFSYFRKNMANVVSADILFELFFVVIGFLLYHFSRVHMIDYLGSLLHNYVLIAFIMYGISLVWVIEILTFTQVYYLIKKLNL